MNEATPEIQQVLGLSRRQRPWLKRLGWGLLVVSLALGGFWLLQTQEREAAKPSYTTAPVERGRLVVTVSATGRLQPTNQVDVGSELSGTIQSVLVQENDRVRKGQVLAMLDPSRLKDQVAQARATLASAEAQLLLAQASEQEARANLDRLKEVARLSEGKLPSRAELETAEAALSKARANVAAARAAIDQAKATLNSNETNLAKSVIRSPIDGVVLARKVEPGQTVAASLQAPVLFVLAEDLARMELQVDIDEADVGQVAAGQSARFSVDAYRQRSYPAKVERVNFGSQLKDGVVTYLAILSVDNDDLSLRPGMTATAEITTAELEDVLRVPNAALRFTPPSTSPAPPKPSLLSALIPRPPRSTSQRGNGQGRQTAKQQVWVLKDGQPVPIEVTLGASDGRMTEVIAGLSPGMEVITEAQVKKK